MTSYNRVILTGKVATLPRRRYRPDGSPVIQFPLELDVVDSTLREVKDLPGRERPQGNRRPALNRTGSGSLIDVVAFGELAEFKLDLLQSGQPLLVVGRLNQRHWQTPEGKKRTRTEVIATDLRRLEELNQTTVCPACGRPCTGLVQGRQATGTIGEPPRPQDGASRK
jgi:single-strand DNA-binding protein